MGRQVPLALTVRCQPAGAEAEAAVAAAGPPQPLALGLEVEPSTAPAEIMLLHNGVRLPQRELVRPQAHPLHSPHMPPKDNSRKLQIPSRTRPTTRFSPNNSISGIIAAPVLPLIHLQ